MITYFFFGLADITFRAQLVCAPFLYYEVTLEWIHSFDPTEVHKHTGDT